MNVALITIAFMTMLGLQPANNVIAQQQLATPQIINMTPDVPVPILHATPLPDIQAASAYVVDATAGTVLYQKNADVARPIASLTKIMTALVILKNHQPDEVVTIPRLDTYNPGDVLAGLVAGDRFALKDLVAAALIPSDNDAADSLAVYDSGTKDKFYGKMNTIAKEWGLNSSVFASASGLMDIGNVSSARDLATMARLGLKNKLFAATTSTKTTRITSGQGRVYSLKTTNDLLDGVRTSGVKTGYTPLAGQCLVTLSKINGHDVISVILASPDRFGETRRLLDWLDAAYTWHTLPN